MTTKRRVLRKSSLAQIDSTFVIAEEAQRLTQIQHVSVSYLQV